jgi:hypothetical protein
MNTPIVSAEAKARLQEAVRNYTPPAPEKYRALEEVKECLIELRTKKASYQTITALLHDSAGIEVSHQTVARYCRELLESKPPRVKSNRSRASKPEPARVTTEGPSSAAQPELVSRPVASAPLHSSRPRGPRIANVKDL